MSESQILPWEQRRSRVVLPEGGTTKGWDPLGLLGWEGSGRRAARGHVWRCREKRGEKWKGEGKGEERKGEQCRLLALSIDLSQAVLRLRGPHQVSCSHCGAIDRAQSERPAGAVRGSG